MTMDLIRGMARTPSRRLTRYGDTRHLGVHAPLGSTADRVSGTGGDPFHPYRRQEVVAVAFAPRPVAAEPPKRA
jgi:hypothetical protein